MRRIFERGDICLHTPIHFHRSAARIGHAVENSPWPLAWKQIWPEWPNKVDWPDDRPSPHWLAPQLIGFASWTEYRNAKYQDSWILLLITVGRLV